MNETTLGAARSHYYEVNGFGSDGGDALEWVPLKVWKLTLKIPNTAGRRKAVRIHDLHHVVTGYQTGPVRGPCGPDPRARVRRRM